MHPILTKKQLFRDGEAIYIQKSTSLPEFIDKLHSHNFIEISYIISGECTHYEYDKAYSAKKGDLFIINYGIPHYDMPNTESPEPFISYDCTFTPDFLDENLKDANDFLDITSSFLFQSMHLSAEEANPVLKLTDSSFNEFEQIFAVMFREYTERQKGYYDLIRSYLLQLIIKIFRKMDSDAEDKTASQANKQKQYVDLAVEYIRNNYNKKISLKDIAYRSMLSKSLFSQIFKEITGMSFLKYLQNVRVERACGLLKDTDDSIYSIAIESGFDDLKFFYTVFKKITGVTPGEYRKNSLEG